MWDWKTNVTKKLGDKCNYVRLMYLWKIYLTMKIRDKNDSKNQSNYQR